MVIDGATDSVIATVAVGGLPWALCYDSQNNSIYCANAGSDDVAVIDGATSQVVATVATDDGPWALGCDLQENKVYCANSRGNSVTVIDAATNQVAATVAAGTSPRALCHNPCSGSSRSHSDYCCNGNTRGGNRYAGSNYCSRSYARPATPGPIALVAPCPPDSEGQEPANTLVVCAASHRAWMEP